MRTNDIRLFLVDDLIAYRTSFAEVLDRESNFRVVGQVSSIAEARNELINLHSAVDIALVGLRLPDGPGTHVLAELHTISPSAQLVGMHGTGNEREEAMAVAAGAAGIFPRASTAGEIIEGVRKLAAGELLIPAEARIEHLQRALAYQAEQHAAFSALSRLTHREGDILRALAEGKSDKETADEWGVSRKTVAAHMANLLEKLGVESRLQAVLLALRYGVVDLE